MDTSIKLDVEQMKSNISVSDTIDRPAIFLIGLQGAGKSMVGNMLLGGYTTNPEAIRFEVRDEDHEKDERRSIGIRTAEVEIHDRKYTLVDTPGIIATETYSRRSWDEIIKANTKAMEKCGVQAYILIFGLQMIKLAGTRLTVADKMHIEEVIKILRADRLIMVFTKRRKDVTIDREKMESTFNEDLRSILKSINNRWVVAPDLDIFGTSDEGKKVIEKNIDELKRMISEIKAPRRKFIGFKELFTRNLKEIIVLTSLVIATSVVVFLYVK
ncbi:4074_t:CDS:2 [Acaulospora morrowiae]|uniref:4074_t:CDS:1 n=1 Tax=Acaulospora morrowiae TaxID=94023 RepID=A0A9N9AUL4_9GLOM|nr:4074_t:CDS:2 [Acaulospora morrowiae]